MRKTKAFTLTEIMVAVAIFTIVAAGLYEALIAGNASWLTHNVSVSLQQQARGALSAMVNELREAKDILMTADAQNLKINFYRPGTGVISYLWSKNGKDAGKIIRKDESRVRVLAQDISSFSLSYPTDNALIIEVTAGKRLMTGRDMSFEMKEKVALRAKNGFFKKTAEEQDETAK